MFSRKKTPYSESQFQRMRAALLWYANEDNWRRHGIHKKGDPVKWVKSAAAVDRGARARSALQKPWSSRLFSAMVGITSFMIGSSKPIVMPIADGPVTLSLVPIAEEAKPGTPLVIPSPIVSTDTE